MHKKKIVGKPIVQTDSIRRPAKINILLESTCVGRLIGRQPLRPFDRIVIFMYPFRRRGHISLYSSFELLSLSRM